MTQQFTTAKSRSAILILMVAILACGMIFAAATGVSAKVTVEKGPNSASSAVIYENKATAEGDYTVSNGVITFTLAGESNNYWGMTKGSILDLAYNATDSGSGAINLTNDIEFLNDYWTATGTPEGYEDLISDVTVEVVEDTDAKAVIKVTTKFWKADADGDGTADASQFGAIQKPLDVVITYTLEDGKDYLLLNATSSNPSDNQVIYKNMHSGFSITTLAASMYGPFGYYPDKKVTGVGIGSDPDVNQANGDFVATYSKTYAVTLHVQDADCYKGSSGYKDLYKTYDIAPGDTKSYDGDVFVANESETGTYLKYAFDRDGVDADAHATVSGKVTDSSDAALAGAYVIAMAKGSYQQTDGTVMTDIMQPFVWDIVDEEGNYSLDLPKGDYTIKVEAEGYTFAEKAISLSAATTEDFKLENGATVKLTAKDQDGNKIPFKVFVEGVVTEMKTLGGAVQFSDAVNKDDPYSVEFTMPKADDITFIASYGSDFESKTASYETDVTAAGVEHEFTIETIIDPQKDGWYCADNHQHSKFGDGATEPIDLYRAQVAAKLDFSIVSDHDSRLYDYEIAGYSAVAGLKIPFIPSLEVSPGWGHWGQLNIDYATTPEQQADANYTGNIVNPSATTPQEIITQGHSHGATVVANHPYTDYGFLNNQASLPTGNSEGWDLFDLVELQSTINLSAMEQGLNAEQWETIDMSNLGATVKKLGYDNIDVKALISAMAFWNKGDKKYLSGGSDQHDAHDKTLYPGKVRQYALLGTDAADYSVDNYVETLREGKAFVTTGPILIPDEENMYGDTIEAKAGKNIYLSLDATAVNGLDEVTLWQNGIPVQQKEFGGAESTNAIFKVKADATIENPWFSFTAADSKGGYAATNPIWVNVTDEALENVKAEIEALPAAEDIALADKEAVEQARADLAALDDAQKERLGEEPVKKLEAAEKAIAAEEKEAADAKAQIEALPAADKVTLDDEAKINDARKAFDALDDEQKALVGDDAKKKLEDAEKAIKELKKPKFVDVPADAYFAEAVNWAVAHDPVITKGTDDTHFSPNKNCNRGEVVTFLWRAAGEPKAKSSNNPFSDVKDGDFYYDAVLWAVENNITQGVDKTHFGPKATCTRGQVVTFLWRAAGEPKAKSANNPFSDVKAKDFFYDAVLWAVENEITTGTDKTHFSPAKTCTRGQVVTFLFRADKVSK